MPSKVDPAILRALSLDSSAKISNHGGSGFTSTYRIVTSNTSVFVKTSTSSGAATMFEGEHTSLNAINGTVPSLCPKSFAWGELENGGFFLATEFLDLSGGTSKDRRSRIKGSGMSLAEKLAKLHTTLAHVPEGYDKPQFGFPVVTCCGDTAQPNDFSPSWAEFFAKSRMLFILDQAEKNNGSDPSLRQLVETVADKVVPKLLGEGHLGGSKGIMPVITHGDLWAGNKGQGSFVGRDQNNPDELGPVEDLVFDPSSTYAHNEWDHGIMNLFGGFGASFWNEYFSFCPKTEPVSEYEDRVALYSSYHNLNHYAMFGGSYKSSAISQLKPLVRKYGSE